MKLFMFVGSCVFNALAVLGLLIAIVEVPPL